MTDDTHIDHVIYSDCDDVHCTVNMTDDRHTDHVIYSDCDEAMYTLQST